VTKQLDIDAKEKENSKSNLLMQQRRRYPSSALLVPPSRCTPSSDKNKPMQDPTFTKIKYPYLNFVTVAFYKKNPLVNKLTMGCCK
jgi:hypothetical protein